MFVSSILPVNLSVWAEKHRSYRTNSTYSLRALHLVCVGFLGLSLGLESAAAEDPWADAVVSYNAIDPNQGFDTPEKTPGEPSGGGAFGPDNSDLHSVGRPGPAPGSFIILKFDTPVTDDPANPMGLDCIVYGNAFWVGGDPNRKLCEPGLIEISEDVNANGEADDPWYRVSGSRGLASSVLPEGMPNPSPPLAGSVLNPYTDGTEYDWGYCELNPTQRKCRDNYVRPDDPFEVGLTPRSGGGDAFDIAWADPIDASGDPGGITQFHFIRISAFIDEAQGVTGYVTPELDAVADVAPDVDNDGDEILDEYETRVAGTDPARPESTVLALEIPAEDGGSALGTELGVAWDAQENAIALISSGPRSGFREYNCSVDILAVADPAPGTDITDRIKSGAVREFQSSVPDFAAAQVQDAEFTVAYTAGEIAGLDEPALQPYRFDGAGFTQDGISSVTKDLATNLVTFRSAYPGIFILASIAGAGDDDAGADEITLNATPPQGTVGAPGTEVSILSDTILLPDDSVVPDGTFFTVATTLGDVLSTDVDAGTPGVQVASSGGTIAFAVRGTDTAGMATLRAASLDGVLHGELDYLFAAGMAQGPIDIFLLGSAPSAPGPVTFTTGLVYDAFGNALDAGSHLTLVVTGGEATLADAAPEEPGHQVALRSGVASFDVRVNTAKDGDSAIVTVVLYADSAQTQHLAEATHILNVAQVPAGMPILFAGVLGLAAVLVLRRGGQRRVTP